MDSGEELMWSCTACTFKNSILDHPECCQLCSTVRVPMEDLLPKKRARDEEGASYTSYSGGRGGVGQSHSVSSASSSVKRSRVGVSDGAVRASRSFMGTNVYRNRINRHPRASDDAGSLSLESLFNVDLLHTRVRDPQLLEVFISGFCGTDSFIEFIMSLSVPITMVAHWNQTKKWGPTVWREPTKQSYNGEGTLLTKFYPPIPMPFGTFHPKLYFMKFKSFLRVVIHSANMEFIPDWCHMGQNIWLQDFSYCDTTVKSSTGFEDDLRSFLGHILRKKVEPGVPHALKMSVGEDAGSNTLYTVSDVDHINRFMADNIDWSGCTVHIVASVPGRHIEDGGFINKYGHRRLGALVSMSQKALPITPTAIVCQGSSMGYKKGFYDEIMTSLTGSAPTKVSTHPLFKIAYPSKDTVSSISRLVHHPYDHVGSKCILFEDKKLAAIRKDSPSYVKFIDIEPPAAAISNDTDIQSLGVKDLKRRLQDRGIDPSTLNCIEKSELVSALQDSIRRGGNQSSYRDILLHSKFIVPVHGDHRVRPWMYCGSHNLSTAAWGKLEKDKTQLCVSSWELGVFFPAVPYDDCHLPFNLTFNPDVCVNETQETEYWKKKGGPFTFSKSAAI